MTMTDSPAHNRMVKQAVNVDKAMADAAREAVLLVLGDSDAALSHKLATADIRTVADVQKIAPDKLRKVIKAAADLCETRLFQCRVADLEDTRAIRRLIETAGREVAEELATAPVEAKA